MVERKFAHPELRGASLQEALDLQRREAGKESGQDQAIREWLEFKRKTAGWTLKPEKVFVDASYEAMVAEENRRLINLQQASIRETQKATKIIEAGRKLARLWGPMAGELLLEGNIQTYREFLKLVASVQYEANHMLGRGLRQYSLRFRDSLSRMEFYENVVSQLGKTGFTLWVKESGVFPSYIDSNGQVHSMENPARMREYAKKLNEEAQIAIEYAFIDTLHECTEIAGANPIAWPQAYTDMLRRRVNYVLKKGLLFGEYNQNMGPSMSGWSLSVDFNKLFGHQGYLDVAVHYQAMIGEEVDSRGNLLSLTNWKGPFKMRNTDKRVESLPYSGQKLLNSPGKRYLFWYAMATKKRMFYGGYKNLQQAQRGRKKRWPSAIERNQARLDKLQTEYDSTSHKSGLTMAEALSEDKVRIKRDMNDLYKRNRYLKENINEKPKGIPIPRNAWEITIAKRVAYWEQNHVAPVWWYLEFGQLRWNPKIPPLGFTYRFLRRARLAIMKLAKEEWERELSDAGVAQDRSGNIVGTGTPIRFGPRKGQARKGAYNIEKRSLFAAMDDTVKNADRNAQEAAKVANIFAEPTRPIGQWGDTSQGVQQFFWYENDIPLPPRGFTGTTPRPSKVKPMTTVSKKSARFHLATTLGGGTQSFNALSPKERGALFSRASTAQKKHQRSSSPHPLSSPTPRPEGKFKVTTIKEGATSRKPRRKPKPRKKPTPPPKG